ncbi:2'-5' RNA ligase family protein [Priestia filamentosa]|uniref:2'-5' RNA ligase family protein n=1 Tax=Priestia filamentosa TaxID=1402861 RepID=UPI001C1E7072|nr:2'-5' RNA ligase family protein [Priestia filamentosa]
MDHFKHDTYVVLDLPKEITEQVRKIRYRFKDKFYTPLPPKITVAGSSGVGVLQNNQEPDQVFKILDDIATKIEPIKASFSEVKRFPYTNIFFFSLHDEASFHNIHKKIAQSDIRFSKNDFPYKPHSTLWDRSSISEKEIQELLSIRLKEEFILNTMSIYSLESPGGDVIILLRHRVTFTWMLFSFSTRFIR